MCVCAPNSIWIEAHWIQFRMHGVWALFYFDLILKRKYKYLVNFVCLFWLGLAAGSIIAMSLVCKCVMLDCIRFWCWLYQVFWRSAWIAFATLPNSRKIIKMNMSVVSLTLWIFFIVVIACSCSFHPHLRPKTQAFLRLYIYIYWNACSFHFGWN